MAINYRYMLFLLIYRQVQIIILYLRKLCKKKCSMLTGQLIIILLSLGGENYQGKDETNKSQIRRLPQPSTSKYSFIRTFF